MHNYRYYAYLIDDDKKYNILCLATVQRTKYELLEYYNYLVLGNNYNYINAKIIDGLLHELSNSNNIIIYKKDGKHLLNIDLNIVFYGVENNIAQIEGAQFVTFKI